MSNITMDMIKDLRQRTGVGMSKCKEALVESEGDVQKAIDYLRKKGMASAVKKEGRETNEGLLAALENDQAIIIVEGNAETDFVTKNERFREFLDEICKHAAAAQPKTVEELLSQQFVSDQSMTVEEYRKTMVQTLGENIQVRRFEYILKEPNHSYGIYSHMGGKIISIVDIEGSAEAADFARSIAMHVAAEGPNYLNHSDVPEDILSHEREIAKSQVKGKPENIIDKIVEGKIRAYCDQVCLVSQKFVKDPSKTIEGVVKEKAKELGTDLKIARFWRWQIGA